MITREGVSQLLINIGTVGFLGKIPLGSLFISWLALPFLLIMRAAYWIHADLFIAIACAGFALMLIALQYTLATLPPYEHDNAQVAVLMGTMLTFFRLSLTAHTVIAGLILFHSVRIIVPRALRHLFGESITYIPGVIERISQEFIAGISAHLVLYLLVLIGYA